MSSKTPAHAGSGLRDARLWSILAVAIALRVWGLGFGLPNTAARPDESRIVGTGARFVTQRTLSPNFFSYPTLFIYVVGGLYAAGCAASAAARAFPSVAACAATWPQDWAPLFMTARAVSALAGAAGVGVMVFLGRRLHRSAGLYSALLLAVAFLHVRDSHFAVTDAAMTSMALLALLLLVRAHERPSTGRFLLAGVCAGLAASTKYNAALVVAAAIVSQILAWLNAADAPRVRYTRLLYYGGAAVAGFLAGTPYALIDRAGFLRDTIFESGHLVRGHFVLLDVGWRYHAMVTLPAAVGWPLFIAGVGGVIWTLVTRTRIAILIFAFPIIYYIVAGRGYTVFSRYMVPVVPFLCLGAGSLIAVATSAVARRSRTIAPFVAAALLVACAAPTFMKAVQLDRLLARTDSRVLAADWLEQHAASGASILFTSTGWGKPQLSRGSHALPYDEWAWDVDRERLAARMAQPPDWIVVEQSPLPIYTSPPDELRPILERYELRHAIHAYTDGEPHVYDQQDAFYLPLDGFARVARPGPNFLIYARRGGQ